MSNANLLRELHRIHMQLRDLRDRQQRGPKQVKAHEANVSRCEAELAQVKTDLKATRMLADQKQLQLRTGQNKINELQIKLNQAASNREYQILRDQIAADQMAGSVLEDEILEVLEKVDEFTPRIAEAEKNVAKAKEEQSRIEKQVREHQGLISGDIERLESELTEAEKRLPDDIRETYFRVVKGRGSDAMAQVDGGNCGGCYHNITTNLMSQLSMGQVVFCLSCGRMLYLPEDRSPVARG